MDSQNDQQQQQQTNILMDKDLYYHQYLTAIFQIYLEQASDDDSKTSNQKLENGIELTCLVVTDVNDKYLTFNNYSHYVFENIMDQTMKTSKRLIDGRFLQSTCRTELPSLFNSSLSYRIHDDYSNRIAYLFDCYYRLEFVKDFANQIPPVEKKKLKRYIIDQAALLLVVPYVNLRYNNGGIDPFDDLFAILPLDTIWPSGSSDQMNYVKKFFVEITDAIHNAKNGTIQDDQQDYEYSSSLSDLSPEELDVELIVRPLYDRFCKKFKNSHFLNQKFCDDIRYLTVLVASPILAEVFIDINSPPALRDAKPKSNTNLGGGSGSSSNHGTGALPQPNEPYRIPLRDILMNLDGRGGGGNSNNNSEMGKFFQESLIGILLSNSPLPSPFSKVKPDPQNAFSFFFSNQDYEYQFFEVTPSTSLEQLERAELTVDGYLTELRTRITDLFYTLLRSPSAVRTKTLRWIECCLATFNGRAQLWANELFSLVRGNKSHVSDGFMLNFSAVLLNLCKPFCSIADTTNTQKLAVYPDYCINLKMLKVDPIYIEYCKQKAATTTDNTNNDYNPYLQVLKQEAFLITCDNEDGGSPENNVLVKNEYQPNFITRCFFMTQKALHIGFRVVHERFSAIQQENNQLQRRLGNIHEDGFFGLSLQNLSPQQRETFNRLSSNMTIALSMKATLTETNYINLLLDFYLASAVWINHLAVCETEEEAMKEFKRLCFNRQTGTAVTDYFKCKPSKCLRLVPEFIIENIIDFMLFLRFLDIKPKRLNLKSNLEPFLVMIILFMGSPSRMRNPHLRAKMAEMLEALLPNVQPNISSQLLESLFLKPYFVEELFPALLSGFVSIEISDEANNADVVAFEQKFNYRRPMYVVFKYLCTIEQHQKKLIDLATFAENNIDCVQSPVFLRFINLLINDAIFLLDEGLSLMAKLKELQQERDSGAWAQLPAPARQQNEANLIHLGRLAKFHNFIGRDTIATLATITSFVTSFFSHRLLVDRMAAMLNYFLMNLVGPNKRNFKVKHMNEYEFHPGELVKNISRIYVNLACNEPISIDTNVQNNVRHAINPKYEEFCLAIGRDDRSYSADLLTQAEEILRTKLNQPMLGQDMLTVDRSVKELIRRYKNSEIPVDEIPEEFLDPLMSTLMDDPVILPNSRKVLDRATITRHLLSDHTDPYTRSPLTMDMLIPDVELKNRIDAFVKAKSAENNRKSSITEKDV